MKEQFLAIIKEALEIEDRELNIEDNFKEYDEWDSLGQLTLIAELDANYSVTIDGETFDKLNTLEELMAEVEKRKA